ncbi:MAG: FecR domain-containing protein [Pseudomonadota bacterium]
MPGTKDENSLYDEAAELFMLLQDAPEDEDLCVRRDVFLARGPDAQEAYRKVEMVFAGVRQSNRKTKPVPIILFLAMLLGVGVWAYDPVRVQLLADIRASDAPRLVTLASDDKAALDALSALDDQSDDNVRRFEVLRGTAFFDVVQQERPFIVAVRDVKVRTLGTAFETALLGQSVLVSVEHGAVEVSQGDQIWQLDQGQALFVRQKGAPEMARMDTDQIAAWRNDALIVDGMTLRDAVAILDRRLPGSVTVFGEIGDLRVTGGFDLSEPEAVLRVLAETAGARVTGLGPLGYILRK